MKPRHLLLGAGLAASAALLWFGDGAGQQAAPDVAEAVERAPARPAPRPARASVPAPAAAPETPILSVVARDALLGDESGESADGDGGFARRDWTPPAPPSAPAPVPAPVAPPPPFAVIGKAVADGMWEVYLGQGERTHLVRIGTVIDGTWRVDAIAPPTLTLTYLPLNQVQQLNIGVFD
jgi:hypothetical protein